MKKRRILTAVLALALAAGLWKVPASAVYQVNWDPQPADWAKEQMEDLADAGILAQGTYNPTAVMTRGRFCYFMVHLVQRVGRRDLLRQVKPMPADYFDDVASETGYGGRYNVYTAASYGLTEGALVDGRRLADCDSDLTREQGAKMMCALMDALEDFTGMDAGGGSGPVVFVDADSISPWARESVDRASSLGILKGDEAGRFNPQGVLTFQEACVMLDRAFRQAEEAGVKTTASAVSSPGWRRTLTGVWRMPRPGCTGWKTTGLPRCFKSRVPMTEALRSGWRTLTPRATPSG